MTIRSDADLENHPCAYKLKDIDKPVSNGETQLVKKIVPKLDENGNQVYKEITIKKGCGCKGKPPTSEVTRVPETMEVTVEESVGQTQPMVLCKLFGTVHKSHCLNCKTYKAKQ
jgi:hypothetical protein